VWIWPCGRAKSSRWSASRVREVRPVDEPGRLNRGPRTHITGEVTFKGHDLVAASERELRGVRGKDIAVVFQDALAALNPLHRAGAQVSEMIRAHRDVTRGQAIGRAVELLGEVGIAGPDRTARAYPHQLSGGMRQRVMIAMGLANDPAVLIADEPTTALDVTIQAQVLAVLKRVQRDHGTSVLLITHDLGVVPSRRPGGGDVRGADRGAGAARGGAVPSSTPLHDGVVGFGAADRRPCRTTAAHHRRQPADRGGPTVRLRVRAPVPFVHDACSERPVLRQRHGDDAHLDACVLPSAARATARSQGGIA